VGVRLGRLGHRMRGSIWPFDTSFLMGDPFDFFDLRSSNPCGFYYFDVASELYTMTDHQTGYYGPTQVSGKSPFQRKL